MNYRVETIDNFEREARRLKKKYRSLKNEISQLIDDLEKNPTLGVPMGNGFYKIRLAIRAKGKGKRGGARVITCVRVVAETVYLISIYDKSAQTDIADATLLDLLSELPPSDSPA
jgi:mRNA-degrading endonuclease RelE of RelBE toxin-antitoxin system